jgi:hypothetical protein
MGIIKIGAWKVFFFIRNKYYYIYTSDVKAYDLLKIKHAFLKSVYQGIENIFGNTVVLTTDFEF